MGFFRSALAVTGWTTLGSTAAWTIYTRKSAILDIPPTDYLFNHTLFARHNPNNNPVTQDVCVRSVPLTKIKPSLLEQQSNDPTSDPAASSRLTEAFCAGLWSGTGYAFQRAYLARKYQDPETADNLWSREELASSKYEVGTKITDHFEVIAKTPGSIVVRCGDSPRVTDVRASDGLFEMVAEVDREVGVVRFGLKSVFYNGVATGMSAGPMPAWIQWLHGQYDKLLMETAIANCTI